MARATRRRCAAPGLTMETEFERFRIDPTIRERAAEVCSRLGYELSEVLRIFVARIADDGEIPFAMPTSVATQRAEAPFAEGERLWGALRAQVEAEVALALLARFVADCSIELDEQHNAMNLEQITRLGKQRDAARRLRRELDVSDPAAVRAVLNEYGGLASNGEH